jgi:hypothetical protein
MIDTIAGINHSILLCNIYKPHVSFFKGCLLIANIAYKNDLKLNKKSSNNLLYLGDSAYVYAFIKADHLNIYIKLAF